MGGSGVALVGAVLADAGQDFSAFDEVLVVADVAVNVTRVSVESDLTCRPPQVASTRDSGRQAAKNIRLVSAIVVAHESTRRRARMSTWAF